MQMINKRMISQRLTLIREYTVRLKRLAQISEKDFIGSDHCAAAESYLRRTLESVFDIGRHILARQGYIELAQEYKSIAKGLQDLRIVDRALGDKLVNIAGYRNRMVHLYNLIADEELYAIINTDLDDLCAFARQILTYLDNLPEQA